MRMQKKKPAVLIINIIRLFIIVAMFFMLQTLPNVNTTFQLNLKWTSKILFSFMTILNIIRIDNRAFLMSKNTVIYTQIIVYTNDAECSLTLICNYFVRYYTGIITTIYWKFTGVSIIFYCLKCDEYTKQYNTVKKYTKARRHRLAKHCQFVINECLRSKF